MARHSANTKRGSALVTSMLLLLFILITGAVLVSWGLYNVQLTVNVRTQQQAYYSAKSVLDATIHAIESDEAARTALDENKLRAMTVKGQSVKASSVNAGAVPGDFALSITCEGPAQDVGGGIREQDYTVTVRAAYTDAMQNRQRAAVSRKLTITRVPANSISGFVGGAAEGAQPQKYNINSTVFLGDVNIRKAGGISVTGRCTLPQNVLLDAKILEIRPDPKKPFAMGIAGDKSSSPVTLHAAQSITVTALGGDNAFGDVTIYADNKLSGKDASMLRSHAKSLVEKPAYEPPQALSYKVREPKTTAEKDCGLQANITVDESSKLTNCDFTRSRLTVNTGGGTIDLVLPDGGANFTTEITVTGGGTVNFYSKGVVFLGAPLKVNRVEGDAAVVNFISTAGGFAMDVMTTDQRFNLIAPFGELFLTSATLHGTVLCNSMTSMGGCTIDTAPTETAWWGDVSNVVEVTSGSGGSKEKILCAVGAYVK
ncbi:MAG: hypothetical protein RSG59_02790 [Ruthenibacterium sp.]